MANGIPLKVWFVNVGHGDCTIVKFPSGRVMMVDISNCAVIDTDTKSELMESAGWNDPVARVLYNRFSIGEPPYGIEEAIKRYESLCDDPIDVMKAELPGESIFRFVLTHPDMDHMTGLYRLFQQEQSAIPVMNFWDTANNKSKPDKMGKGYDCRDWDEYERIRTQEGDPKVLRLYRGASGDFYASDGISILSPTEALMEEWNEGENWNEMSQVLRIEYGESSLLLPGDVESAAQRDMLEAFGSGLKSTIYKAPHHGRESGYHEEFAEAVSPEYTIVSVGKKPETDASNKYKKHTSKKVLSTRFHGTIYGELYADGDVKLWNSPKKDRKRIDAQGELEVAFMKLILGRRDTGLRIG